MATHSWRRTNLYKRTRMSGGQFEESVAEVIHRYTNSVWRNVRIETLLTQTGNTELDVVFYYGGVVYILELKRVRKIIGSYARRRWTMYGWLNNIDETSEYTALNVIEQNNIHVRSLSDLYYSEFNCFPTIRSAIVVPSDCVVPDDLKSVISTVDTLEDFIVHTRAPDIKEVSYRLSWLLNTDSPIIQRSDFVDRGMREGEAVRGLERK